MALSKIWAEVMKPKVHENHSIWKLGIFTLTCLCFLIQTFLTYSDYPENGRDFVLNSKAKKGLRLWRKYSCAACHQLYGMGGFLGPDLTNVTQRLPESVLNHYLDQGGFKMPALNLKEDERQFVIEFLRSMNQTGQGTLVETEGDLPWYQYQAPIEGAGSHE